MRFQILNEYAELDIADMLFTATMVVCAYYIGQKFNELIYTLKNK